MTKFNLRPMVDEDIDTVVDMCFKFFEQTKYTEVMLFEHGHLAAVLHNLVRSDDFLGVVAEDTKTGGIAGFITAIAVPHTLCNTTLANEQGWWVEPQYRGTSVWLQLINFYQDWAREKGCLTATIGAAEGVTNLERVLPRLGYTKTDSTWMKRL